MNAPAGRSKIGTYSGDQSMAIKKCPVCAWEIKDEKSVKVNGRVVLVCCDDCAEKVKANPQKYVKAK
jgi:YHS domain-containing protein